LSNQAFFPRRLAVLAAMVAVLVPSTGCTGTSHDTTKTSDLVETQAPGEATLQILGEKTRTKIKRVSLRDQAIPGADYSRAAEGKVYLTFQAEVENVGKTSNNVGGGYSLKTPDGQVAPYTGVADGEGALTFDNPLAPGEKKSGTLTWEVTIPKNGNRYVLMWKPNPLGKAQADFEYKYKAPENKPAKK